jgi:hypothetical protein
VLFHPIVTPANERPNRGGSGIKNGDAIIFNDSPKSIGLGPVRRALIHQGGGTQAERAINNVTVTGDPADIRCAPEKILVANIEDIFRRCINP